MPGALQIVIVYNKACPFGLSKDVKILTEGLSIVCKPLGYVLKPVKCMDSREPPIPCDICIHLEVPYAVWFSWAKVNIMMVNSEWWLEDKWSSYWNSFDFAVFRKGTPTLTTQAKETRILPWCTMRKQAPVLPAKRSSEFVWFLGGSVNKRAAAEAILPLWCESYPTLHVYCTEPLPKTIVLPKSVQFHLGFLSNEAHATIAASAAGHVCISRAESFGYSAAEAEEHGAFRILNTLPCYVENYPANSSHIHWLETSTNQTGHADFTNQTALEASLDTAIRAFRSAIETPTFLEETKVIQENALKRRYAFLQHLSSILEECVQIVDAVPTNTMPPVLLPVDCPPISIITLVHNRPRFIENACLNLLHSDYPRDKIEWVVVDDSDPAESASNRIVQFGEKFSPGIVTYVPLTRKRSIGYKRNIGVERSKHSILLMMDDDDHYPITSFRRRVAYLLKHSNSYACSVCTTIAMYDLIKGVSAVNVPPYTLSLGERASEATLTFTKAFWKERPFVDVSMAEAEDFLRGREKNVVEIPPQQIIVAMTHGTNLSGRKTPDITPGCFWGFSRPLLEFLHGLVGIKVEEEDLDKESNKDTNGTTSSSSA